MSELPERVGGPPAPGASRPSQRATVGSILLALLLLAGCSKSAAPPAPSRTGTATGSGSATPTASPTPTAAALPDSCSQILPIVDLDQALGIPLVGRTAYIRGVAEPKIKRLGRVTCRYGLRRLPGNKTTPARLEVGISVYADAGWATKRIESTVTASRSEGAAPKQVQVSGRPATVLLGAGPPLIVLALDTRTIAISFGNLLVRGDPTRALVAVAELAVKNLPQ